MPNIYFDIFGIIVGKCLVFWKYLVFSDRKVCAEVLEYIHDIMMLSGGSDEYQLSTFLTKSKGERDVRICCRIQTLPKDELR